MRSAQDENFEDLVVHLPEEGPEYEQLKKMGQGVLAAVASSMGGLSGLMHAAWQFPNDVPVLGGKSFVDIKLAINNHGYGTLRVDGRTVYAHRLAYELATGKTLPNGLDARHKCDNPRCINPAHIEPGTRSQNMKECHERGRSRIPAPRMKGESNGSAKLTSANITDIKNLINSGEVQRVIAERFGVSQSLISLIKRGILWND